MAFDQSDYCAFCNMPGAKHEGGAEFNGQTISGKFCNKVCFDKWLKWKEMLFRSLKKEENPDNAED